MVHVQGLLTPVMTDFIKETSKCVRKLNIVLLVSCNSWAKLKSETLPLTRVANNGVLSESYKDFNSLIPLPDETTVFLLVHIESLICQI